MFLKELIRFSTQHRTLYCYMILSIWIFLLIASMYKYIGQNGGNSFSQTLSIFNEKSFSNFYSDSTNRKKSDINDDVDGDVNTPFHLSKARCSNLPQLQRHEEGGILDGWKLYGVLMVIRHGDRGPMSHVRSINNIDCGIVSDTLVNRYRSYLYNSTSLSGANHMYWNKVGAFHGFPLLPVADKACLLGQLTYKGIAQMLHIGEMLQQIYANPLGLLFKQSSGKGMGGVGTTPNSMLNSDEVVLYSTRYRRTFQSALAFLYAFLPQDKWLALNVRESHSMAFCFIDCACPQAELLRRQLAVMRTEFLAKQPPLNDIMQSIGSTLLEHTPNGITDPNEVIDALLSILCHDAPLPCKRMTTSNAPSLTTTETNDLEQSDVINIDQDDIQLAVETNPNDANRIGSESLSGKVPSISDSCIEATQVHELLSSMNQQSRLQVVHPSYRKIGLMRAYGMVRHIVSYMLKMISGDRTKLVLYSGHDWSLQFLTSALGIHTETTFIPYAARLAFELYKSDSHVDYYFRVIYNGRDVTQEIDFCEGGRSLRVTRDSRGNKADLCPIENIIRFLHEDYFAPLNATNFKDACSIINKPNEF